MGKKTIFISGVAGFLGSHLADALIAEGHRVVGCDNLIGGYLDNVSPEVDFYQYDCTYLNSMVKITRHADVVVHTAATAYEGLSVFAPHLVTKNIVQASVSLISAAIQNRVRRFVYCSSMARYGANPVPFTEDMPCRPQDPYGIGKVCGEQLLVNLAQTHGMQWVIAVPHNIIGPRQKYDDPYRNVASIMANLMLQGRQPIIYGDGEQRRCFSDIADVVGVLEKLIFVPEAAGEVFNIGPDEEFVSINQLARLLADVIGFDLQPVYYPERPQEVKEANCSAEKARRLLGYRTTVGLRQSLTKIVDYIRERGPKPFRYHLDLEIINDKTPVTWKERKF